MSSHGIVTVPMLLFSSGTGPCMTLHMLTMTYKFRSRANQYHSLIPEANVGHVLLVSMGHHGVGVNLCNSIHGMSFNIIITAVSNCAYLHHSCRLLGFVFPGLAPL